jgi:DNA-binding NarL/FixJ family response regulator
MIGNARRPAQDSLAMARLQARTDMACPVQSYVTPLLAPIVARRQAEPSASPDDVLATLSVREREVFHMVAAGIPSKVIAQELCVSSKTVDTHISRIHRKLGCKRVADLVRFAAVHGLLRQVPPDPDPSQPRRNG